MKGEIMSKESAKRLKIKCKNGKRKFLYRHTIELIIGYELPQKSVIHHVDGDGLNNSNNNLVVCQDENYHRLLHKRSRAYKECGHANWIKCEVCKKYDDQQNMYIRPELIQGYHSECINEYHKLLRLHKKSHR